MEWDSQLRCAAHISAHTIRPLKEKNMPTITTKDGTQIYYKDWGTGQPVVFSHGWPLSADAWEDQMFFLANRGFAALLNGRARYLLRGYGHRQ